MSFQWILGSLHEFILHKHAHIYELRNLFEMLRYFQKVANRMEFIIKCFIFISLKKCRYDKFQHCIRNELGLYFVKHIFIFIGTYSKFQMKDFTLGNTRYQLTTIKLPLQALQGQKDKIRTGGSYVLFTDKYAYFLKNDPLNPLLDTNDKHSKDLNIFLYIKSLLVSGFYNYVTMVKYYSL